MRLAHIMSCLTIPLMWMALIPLSALAGRNDPQDGGQGQIEANANRCGGHASPAPVAEQECTIATRMTADRDGGSGTSFVYVTGESIGRRDPDRVTAGELMAMSPRERRSFMNENAPSSRVGNFGTDELDDAQAQIRGQYLQGMAGVVGVLAMAAGNGTGASPSETLSPAVAPKKGVDNATKELGRVIYPRGLGAATGPVPHGHVRVSRWVNEAEAKYWIANGGTNIPGGVGGQSGRVYVTVPGAPRPGGTGPIRIDFTVDAAALTPAGKEGWFQIIQPVQNMPIHNVTLTYPPGM